MHNNDFKEMDLNLQPTAKVILKSDVPFDLMEEQTILQNQILLKYMKRDERKSTLILNFNPGPE